jgi:hypothetical protein
MNAVSSPVAVPPRRPLSCFARFTRVADQAKALSQNKVHRPFASPFRFGKLGGFIDVRRPFDSPWIEPLERFNKLGFALSFRDVEPIMFSCHHKVGVWKGKMVIGKGSFCAVAPFLSFPPIRKRGGRRDRRRERSDFFGSFPSQLGRELGKEWERNGLVAEITHKHAGKLRFSDCRPLKFRRDRSCRRAAQF